MESFEFFLEMPMSFYGHDKFQELSPNLGFNKFDRNIITNKTAAKKLEQILSKCKWNFNIIFLEQPIIKTKEKLQEKIKEYIEKNNIEVKNHITYVKQSSSGDPLTPWMTLHTLAHALYDGRSRTVSKLLDTVQETEKCLKNQNIKYVNVEKLAEMLFAFKSLQLTSKSKLLNAIELAYELVAEFLWHGGKIRINPKAKEFFEDCAFDKVKEIEDQISKSLDSLTGLIFTD